MYVQDIALASWRNIASSRVSFGEGINVLWGMNAQGKSNILEGIYYFARGRSFRGAKDRELIRFGDGFASASLTFRHDGYENDTVLDCTIPYSGKKRIRKNSSPLSSSAEMMGVFRAVLFCPKDLSLVTGGPADRRTFLDVALSQLSETYLTYLRRYTKALAERNALLKHAAEGNYVSSGEWEVFAEVMASCAAVICAYRNDYVKMLSAHAEKYFDEMTSGREKPTLSYISHSLYDEIPPVLSSPGGITLADVTSDSATRTLREKLSDNIEREKAAGATLWGVHKDDITLSVNGMEAKLYASQGQQRSLSLSMKLGEAEIANRLGGEYPVILLDDVFSELDETRRKYILEILSSTDEQKSRQIIITSCEPDIIPQEKLGHVTFRNVRNGEIIE